MLNKNYNRDTFDLEELNLHNGIEHCDASLTRLGTSLQPNQSVPHPAFIEELSSFATGKDAVGNPLLTNKDLSRILGKRRAESKATNKEYNLRFAHRVFGSTNASTMSTVFLVRMNRCLVGRAAAVDASMIIVILCTLTYTWSWFELLRESCETSRQGHDIKVVSYKYKKMKQKEDINLGVVVFKVEVGTGELGLDDLPEPVHWRTKRHVGGIG
ncbi:hypothetical protein HD554DRAFT_2096480 [Boletus coccyginus]|nr:hypothetical protein HD554DRAFT_2096480 [Boletus coccyginus]